MGPETKPLLAFCAKIVEKKVVEKRSITAKNCFIFELKLIIGLKL